MKTTHQKRKSTFLIGNLATAFVVIFLLNACVSSAPGVITERTVDFQLPEPARSLAFDKSGGLAASSMDGNVYVWDLQDSKQIAKLSVPEGWASSIAFSNEGSVLAAGSHGGWVTFWRVPDFTVSKSVKISGDLVSSVAFSPRDDLFAASVLEGPVFIFDSGLDSPPPTIDPNVGRTNRIAFSPDGSKLASAHGGEDLSEIVAYVWAIPSKNKVLELLGTQPTSSLLATASPPFLDEGALTLTAGDINSIEFSPSGSEIIAAGSDGAVRVWSISSGSQVVALLGPPSSASWADFLGDSGLVGATYWDGYLRIWDVANGEMVASMRADNGMNRSAVTNSSGDTIATSGENGTIRLWSISHR